MERTVRRRPGARRRARASGARGGLRGVGALLLAAFVLPTGVAAQDAPAGPGERLAARSGEAIDALVEELDVSEEQEPRFRAILESAFDERAALADRLAALRESDERPRTRLQEMRSLRADAAAQRSRTRAALAEVLDEAQLARYEEIRDARRARMREAWSRRRGVAAGPDGRE